MNTGSHILAKSAKRCRSGTSTRRSASDGSTNWRVKKASRSSTNRAGGRTPRAGRTRPALFAEWLGLSRVFLEGRGFDERRASPSPPQRRESTDIEARDWFRRRRRLLRPRRAYFVRV